MNFNLHDLLTNQFLVGLSGATVLGGVLYVCRQIPHHLWRLVLDQFSVGFDVKNSDHAFYWMEQWLAQHPYAARTRSLRLTGGRNREAVVRADEDDGEDDAARPKYILSPAPGNYLVMIHGRLAFIQRTEKEQKEAGAPGVGVAPDKQTINVRIFGRNRVLLRKIVEDAYKVTHTVAKTRLMVHVNHSDYWQIGARQSLRPLGSVILPAGLVEALVADMSFFLGNKRWYEERAIPWRRGYKLQGPPGCGKSSLVAGLASHVGMGVSVLSLNNVTFDGDLIELLLGQPANTLLLIEDLDAAFTHDRKSDQTKITFSSFLNALDGLIAPSGRLLFVTTNHPERLDPALVRPGRIDVTHEITYANEDQAGRFFKRFFPDAHAIHTETFGQAAAGMAPAEIQNILLEHQDDPAAAVVTVTKRRAA